MPGGDDYKCLIDTDTKGRVSVPATPSQTSPSDQSIQCTVPLVSDWCESTLIYIQQNETQVSITPGGWHLTPRPKFNS